MRGEARQKKANTAWDRARVARTAPGHRFERRFLQRLLTDGLIELVFWLRLCHRAPVGQGLDGRLVPGGRSTCGRDRRRLGRLADVNQYARDWGGLSDEGDDAPVGAAVRADQGQGLEQAHKQYGGGLAGAFMSPIRQNEPDTAVC